MIHFLPCFGMTGDEGRFLSPSIIEGGHKPTLERLLASPCRRTMVHLPFGKNASEIMDFDGYGECQRAGLGHVSSSYIDCMAEYLSERPEATLYTYLGSPKHDPDMIAREGDHTAYAHRWHHSIYPVMQLAEQFASGRVGLALDKTDKLAMSHPLAGLMLSAQAMLGVPLVVEGARHAEAWQADAGMARVMISPRWTDEGQIDGWPGEQIALASTSGRIADMSDNWNQTITEAGFTPCGY